MHTRYCLSPLSVSGGYGVDSKHDFTPPTILLGLLLCAGLGVSFLVGYNSLMLMVLQNEL